MHRWVLPLLTASTMMAAPIYSIVQIGGRNDQALAISRNGTVAGHNTVTPSSTFVDNGTFTNIGRVAGFDTSPGGVNDSGMVTAGYNLGQRAAFWDGSNWIDLHASLGATFSRASDINNAGEITGNAGTQVFIRSPSGTVTLIPGMSNGFSINSSGQIAGATRPGTSDNAAIRDTAGTVTNLNIEGLSSAVGASQAYTISDNGYAAGTAFLTAGGSRGFICTPILSCNLVNGGFGTFTQFRGINSSGVAIGQSGLTAIIHESGITTSLATLIDDPSGLIRLSAALDINDAGQIVAVGRYTAGPPNEYSFLLTPITAVPEPATYAITALGLGVIALRRRR